MNDQRIAVTISPHIEELFLQKKYDSLFNFFKKLLNFSKELRNSILILLPQSFRYGFKCCDNPMLKVFYSQINLPNSVITFYPDGNHCNLSLLDKQKNDIVVGKNSLDVLSAFLKSFKIPLIISDENYTYYKDECNKNECNNKPCLQMLELDVAGLKNSSTFIEKLRENCNKNLKEWIIYKNNIKISDFKSMFYFAAFSMDAKNELYDKIKEIEFLDDEILKDIKNEDPYVLKDIATSILRAFFYEPASNRQKREKYSIDYHPNNPGKKNGYDLLRLDVIDMKDSGYKNNHSGPKRILLARKKGKKYVIAYVSDHEFSDSLINARIEALDRKLNQIK